jgi:hypothetical protein
MPPEAQAAAATQAQPGVPRNPVSSAATTTPTNDVIKIGRARRSDDIARSTSAPGDRPIVTA